MTQSAVVRARIDDRTKAEAAAVLGEMGLTISDAFRIMLRRIARDKAVPLDFLAPGPVTVAALKETDLPRFQSVDALIADLNADD